MKLEEMLKRMVPSDRLIIREEDGTELYQGYVACLQHYEVDTDREVKRFGLDTDIFRKENRQKRVNFEPYPEEKVDPASIGDFCFLDLEMLIYTRIILEKLEFPKKREEHEKNPQNIGKYPEK